MSIVPDIKVEQLKFFESHNPGTTAGGAELHPCRPIAALTKSVPWSPARRIHRLPK